MDWGNCKDILVFLEQKEGKGIVEGAAGHPISAYRNPINFRSLSCSDRLLHRFKYIRFSHLQTEKKAPES